MHDFLWQGKNTVILPLSAPALVYVRRDRSRTGCDQKHMEYDLEILPLLDKAKVFLHCLQLLLIQVQAVIRYQNFLDALNKLAVTTYLLWPIN